MFRKMHIKTLRRIADGKKGVESLGVRFESAGGSFFDVDSRFTIRKGQLLYETRGDPMFFSRPPGHPHPDWKTDRTVELSTETLRRLAGEAVAGQLWSFESTHSYVADARTHSLRYHVGRFTLFSLIYPGVEGISHPQLHNIESVLRKQVE